MTGIASDDNNHSSETSSSSSTSDERDTTPAEDVEPAPGTDANGRRSSVADVIDPVVAEVEGSSGDYGLQGKDDSMFLHDFDVVTIHGLHGHRETTWQAWDESKRETVRGLEEWKYDLGFRLMNYGYDAFKTLSKEGITKEASKLLRAVVEARHGRDKVYTFFGKGGGRAMQVRTY
ncbi:hypothetical protein COCVIDRAFT_105298 [Bipolaris victoriae FI3]|uniref:DUF676 domain-containing protein n=1 Tax=Bipolaris victoriae (strain FI3) TaxID=930091 RepID=W7E966_BIPV3|nr:hypothetical protein COCVIDRAFT_105298 [Bipolaris victoriae FI3]